MDRLINSDAGLTCFLQYREMNNKFSVMARIWNPQKTFYEHPTLIDMNFVDVICAIEELYNSDLTAEEILLEWTYIGD